MNKSFAIFLVAFSTTLSLQGGYDKAKIAPSSYHTIYENNDSVSTKSPSAVIPWITVTAKNALELTAAIKAAAANITASTKINVTGIILGNFTVPSTINEIELFGTEISPTISANNTGTPLTISLGATVTVNNLKITGARGGGNFGIINRGYLKIYQSTITSFTSDGGILNSGGNLFVSNSSIDENFNAGIISQGQAEVNQSSVSRNSSEGIVLLGGTMLIKNSSINENGNKGFFNYIGTKAIIDNCIISNNTNYGVWNYFNSVSISNSTIENNSIGGIYCQGVIGSVENSIIANHSNQGIFNNTYSQLQVKDCIIQNNHLSGIHNYYISSVNISDSEFQNNSSTAEGGAIYNDSSSVAKVSSSTFSGNSATSGGAIYNGNIFTLIDSNVENNLASENGGGIYNNMNIVIRNTGIKNNSSSNDGGGVYNLAIAKVIASSIEQNIASQGGGFANINPGLLSLVTSTVKYNTATDGVGSGGGIYSNGTLSIASSDVSENAPDQTAP